MAHSAAMAFRYCRLSACKGKAGTLYLGNRLLVANTNLLSPKCGYATVAHWTVKEQPVPVEGTVKGSIPPWVSGRLLRNGPGMFEVGNTKHSHWFDGLALLHSFTIANGKVIYRSRYLRSETYRQNMAANRIVATQFGRVISPDLCKTIFQRVQSVFSDSADNDLVNIYPIGRDFVAASESDIIHSFDPETLETKDRIKLSECVAVNTATAHPHYELDGATYNLGSSFSGGAHYNIVKINPNMNGGQLNGEVLCSIPAKRKATPNYCHSFGMTENYFIFLEQPIYLNLKGVFINKITGRPLLRDFFNSNNEETTRLYVVDRHTGKVVETKYMSADTFFCFHHANAYEDKGHLVVDMCCHGDGELYNLFSFETQPSEAPEKDLQDSESSVRRYILPLGPDKKPVGENLVTLDDTSASAVRQKDGTVLCTHELLSPIAFDFPQINYGTYNGKKYSTMYGSTFSLLHGREALVRLDMKTKQTKLWQEEDYIPSEPVFVARPGASEEDDGIILSSVLHNAVGKPPFLLILDARSFEELARVEFGVDIHRDFHGLFVPFSSAET